jgi:hypothetical protein
LKSFPSAFLCLGGSLNIITPRDAPLYVAANDETAIIIPKAGNVVMFVCTHCGNLKQAHTMFIPGQKHEEYQLYKKQFETTPICLCLPTALRGKEKH